MFENVIREIDAQIARLQQARAALSGTSTSSTGKRRGRPPGGGMSMSASAGKKRGRRKGGMSAEGRARIAAAQKARWAKIKAGK